MTRRGRLRDELRRLGNSPVPVLDPAPRSGSNVGC